MKGPIPVSAIVMTRNEERNIAKCLRALSCFGEVFVVDSGSSDRTCAIADEMGARCVQFRWNGQYPKKKQWCLLNLPFTHDWVYYVDADEEPSPALCEEITRLMEGGPPHDGYFASYDYAFLGRVLRHGHRVYKLVLFNRHRGRFADQDDLAAVNMWEVEGHYQPVIEGTTGVLKARMLHNDHDSLFHYFERHNRYSDWEATLRRRETLVSPTESQIGYRRFLKAVFKRIPFKGAAAFLHSYIFALGFLDGAAGFHYALARGFYYWQARAKQLEMKSKSEDNYTP